MEIPRKRLISIFVFVVLIVSCRHSSPVKKNDLVDDPAEMDQRVKENIASMLSNAADDAKLPDSSTLAYYPVLKNYYDADDRAPLWSAEEKWKPCAAALVRYLDAASLQGLYKEDYHYKKLTELKSLLDNDSVKRKDAVIWAKAELLMTDALTGMLRDLKQGRLQPDSLSWKYDTARYRNYFTASMEKIRNGEPLDSVLEHVQPSLEGYRSLKKGIRKFIDSMDTRTYTYLEYPYKDSLKFLSAFRKRMSESGINIEANIDSAGLAGYLKRFQKENGLTVDGKIGKEVVKRLNLTDRQKFNLIAVTLDKYKSLPEKMPEKYIWVNLPGYYMKVWDSDTLVFDSKVICGKPATPTPLITSAITDIVIYPTWTVPASIIKKEMLPGLKRNPGYLARKGLYLLNDKGERVNPYGINWAKYSKGIPFRIQQGSGDDNALGVIKFNFSNPFSVYLHDTNQRYLFKNGIRCLSHGCVRVQEWQKLADYIVRNDSLLARRTDTLRYNTDSIANWIANKERHTIVVKQKLPLFIRYFSCEGDKGDVKFYDDMYGDDRELLRKYFAGK